MKEEIDENSRVEFERGCQKAIFDKILKKNELYSLRNISKDLSINYSTLKKYHQEKRLMKIFFVRKLCNFYTIPFDSLKIKEIKEPNWGAVIGGKRGMASLVSKYPEKISKWREKGDKRGRLKKIKIPKLDEDLAELIGVYLGDGTMTPYFIRISGDYRYDLSYFNYLSKKIYKLFNVDASINKEKNRDACYLLISSKEVCAFLKDNYQLNYGDKIRNQSRIPPSIIKNKKLALSCLRGLVDTDGSVSRRGKQFCVQFASNNKTLLSQVHKIGKNQEIFTYLSGNETGTNRWLNVIKYFRLVGSSNIKNVIRFSLKYKENKGIYIRDVPEYAKKSLYSKISLPFKMGP